VLIDVQRAGPATGQATHVAQGDVMQFKYGSHGDYYPIAVAPWSVQELYDLTIHAFNLAEKYRLPVFVATDEAIGHARENVEIYEEFEIFNRVRKGDGPPFGHDAPDGVPVMPAFGDGANLMVTGSTHNPLGFRKVDDPEVHDTLVTRLMRKTMDHVDEIVETEDYYLDDAEIGFFSFGISARTSIAAVKRLREKGVKAGLLRTRTLWPFPEKQVSELGKQVRALIVPELNKGMYASVARAYSEAPVHQINKTNGYVLEPKELIEYVEEELS
jgi:2-oxoglutarate ferredoxin oxidoreductase subunit alpha